MEGHPTAANCSTAHLQYHVMHLRNALSGSAVGGVTRIFFSFKVEGNDMEVLQQAFLYPIIVLLKRFLSFS